MTRRGTGHAGGTILRSNLRRHALAIGLMSGTSQDGVDVALIETDGEIITRFGRRLPDLFAKPERALLRRATAAAAT